VSYYRTTVLHDRVRADLGYLGHRSLAYDVRLLATQAMAILRRLL
jgi:hypothetical protein